MNIAHLIAETRRLIRSSRDEARRVVKAFNLRTQEDDVTPKLPDWILYRGQDVPKKGNVFEVVEIVEGVLDIDSGEHVTAVMLKPITYSERKAWPLKIRDED